MPTPAFSCPECNADCPAGQVTCTHCGAALAVNVVLTGPVADGRLRFQLAKALVALPPAGRAFADVQSSLAVLRPVLAHGVTFALAQRYLEECARLGVTARTERDVPMVATPMTGAAAPSRSWRTLGAVVGFVASAATVYVGQVHLRSRGADDAAQTRATSGPSAATLEKAIRSTVAVRCKDSRAAGFFVSETHLLTNAHAVCPESQMMQIVLHDGRKVLGKTRKRDDRLDLALVEVAGGGGEPLPLADASLLQAGDPVAAIGSPQGLEFTVSRGSVSYVGRTMVGVGFLQIDINVNPGNSGGPIVDGKGRVVGVMSMMMKDANGLGLALPINYAFDGKSAMIPAPEGLALTRWRALLAKVEAADGEDAVAAKAALERTGLLSALLKPNGALIAVLMVRSEAPPARDPVQVELDNGQAGKCSGAGFPIRWSELKGIKDHRLPDPRLGTWLRDHALTDNLWLGMQELTLGCVRGAVPAHSVLRLVEGHESLEKAIVRASTEDLLVVESASARAPATPEEAAKQGEVARLEAEAVDAARAYSACEERARNMGSGSYGQCSAPGQKLGELRTKLERAKRELRAMSALGD